MNIAPEIRIKVNPALYLRDPDETELGRKLIANGLKLMDEIGFEKFTFKKLAEDINSTEASMYRYFESKHKFLSYLLSWYWNWINYSIEYHTNNVSDPAKKLKIALKIMTESVKDDPATSYVDEAALHRLMVVESVKVYFAKDANKQEKAALAEGFVALTESLAKLLKEVNPRYKKPKALASTLIIGVQRQSFYADHLPGVTDLTAKGGNYSEVESFIEDLALRVLG